MPCISLPQLPYLGLAGCLLPVRSMSIDDRHTMLLADCMTYKARGQQPQQHALDTLCC